MPHTVLTEFDQLPNVNLALGKGGYISMLAQANQSAIKTYENDITNDKKLSDQAWWLTLINNNSSVTFVS